MNDDGFKHVSCLIRRKRFGHFGHLRYKLNIGQI